MLKIGLTGGMGSGKSTVADLFAKQGIAIIDTDQLAYELTESNTESFKQIIQHFGNQILQKNGTLDRAQLKKIIFTDPTERDWLEQTLHPLIIAKMQQAMQTASGKYCITVVPLLIEKNLLSLFDRILVIDVTETTQLQRLQEREPTHPTLIKKILDTQCTRQQRLAIADDIINNDGDLTQLYQQVAKLNTFYQKFH